MREKGWRGGGGCLQRLIHLHSVPSLGPSKELSLKQPDSRGGPCSHSKEKVLALPTADIREEPSDLIPRNYPGTDNPLVINPH